MATQSERTAATNAVARAIRAGDLDQPTTCEACGGVQGECTPTGTRIQRLVWHHHSYRPEHRLDVIAMCLSCHQRCHYGSIPEPRTGRVYKSAGKARKDQQASRIRENSEWRKAHSPKSSLSPEERAAIITRISVARILRDLSDGQVAELQRQLADLDAPTQKQVA